METKNSFIRKAIALAMCGVMVFSLTSCTGDRGSSEDSSISNPITEPPSGDPVEPEQTVLDNINAAFAVNNDVVGWLTVPGTEIDEQVVQGDTNTEYERLSWDRKDADGDGVPDYDFYATLPMQATPSATATTCPGTPLSTATTCTMLPLAPRIP